MRDLAEDVAEIPRGVGGEIDRIGPGSLGGDAGLVAHGEGDRERLTRCAAARRRADVVDHEIGRRRLVDQHRQGCCG